MELTIIDVFCYHSQMDFITHAVKNLQMDRKGRNEPQWSQRRKILLAALISKQSDQAKYGADSKYRVNKSFIHIVPQCIDQLNTDNGYRKTDAIHDR